MTMAEPDPLHLSNMFEPAYAVPSFGFVVPPLALAVGIINSFMIWILTRPNMRSPVNMLLVCIAWSDSLTVLLPVPAFVYFYTLGNYQDFVPYSWCRVFFYCVHVFPLLSNMASLWATVALAFMRCYSVWRPLLARSRITIRKTCVVIVTIYAFSILVYTPLTFQYAFSPLSMTIDNTSTTTCQVQQEPTHNDWVFCGLHTWVQIICTSLLPWLLIAFPNFGLLWKLRKADDNRKMLRGSYAGGEESMYATAPMAKGETDQGTFAVRKSRGRVITMMIFIAVTMVWIVEIPFGIVFSRYLERTVGDVMRNSLGGEVVFVFLLKYITYPFIFLMYCLMSGNFRQTMKNCFFCRSGDESSVTRTSISREKKLSQASSCISNM